MDFAWLVHGFAEQRAFAHSCRCSDAQNIEPFDAVVRRLPVVVEVQRRTLDFGGWQKRWLPHCGDGAEFHGRVGAKQLSAYHDVRGVLRADLGRCGWSADQLDWFLESLDADGGATSISVPVLALPYTPGLRRLRMRPGRDLASASCREPHG